MSAAQVIVTVTGAGVIALIAWFFWAPRGEGVRARQARGRVGGPP
jgi:hypothetical protein